MNALLQSRISLPALLVALALAGCGDEKKAQTADADAGADQGPPKAVLDGKLAAAVKAAESSQGSSSSKGGDGPPENGVFAPGMADKAQAAGAPAKFALLEPGKEPRVRLVSAPAEEQKETVSLTVRLNGGAIPVEYALGLKIDRPKDEKKDDKKTDGPKSVRVVGKVLGVSLSPQLPRELSDKLGKLKGTELHYSLGPDGGAGDLGFTMAKDADPALGEVVVKGLVEAIGVGMPPLPKDPVGLGGYWMVTNRASSFTDVVRYRVYKVEKLDKDAATLSVDVRQYATRDDADLGGQKISILRFDSTAKGKIDWTAAGLLPVRGDTSQRTTLQGNVGGQQAGLQAEVAAKFAAAEPEKADKKK